MSDFARLVYQAVTEFRENPDMAEVEVEQYVDQPDGVEICQRITIRREVRNLTTTLPATDT